jgi:hydrogenase maturation protein HypF
MESVRACVQVKGVVQGVGFRPFVYDLAKENDLKGWVLNDEKGVMIEIEGQKERVKNFLSGLSSPPPIARIENTAILYEAPLGYSDFEIKTSENGEDKCVLVSPDIATCQDCLDELFDPHNPRFYYPFINCTNCGPRFTIITNVPYDRANTTMSPFKMCPMCSSEYHNPADRRFHAQPNACPECGPALQLFSNDSNLIKTHNPLREAITLLKRGAIIAIKGIGGFHIACDATKENVVAGLRARKYREDKPFALMCRDMGVVKSLCVVDDISSDLLASKERPIVILPRKRGARIASSVAPFQKTLGVMLPYTPLHHLLFDQKVRVLVMTSGNVSDEPIVYSNKEAFSRLCTIADFFLVHDRQIYTRCDDSVVKPLGETKVFFRRSRGFAPFPIKLNKNGKHILACGADMKNTFCLTKDDYAFMSQHIGDMENFETLRSFEQGIDLFKKMFQIEPELIVHDLHPDYFSTSYAYGLDVPQIGIQHHFAHALSCMAEYGAKGPCLAIIMDGTGYGEDGCIWGGEFLEVTVQGYKRLGHLRYIPLPGGDKAVQEPWRMAAIYLERIYGRLEGLSIPFLKEIDLERWSQIRLAVKFHINSPLCSSTGRLFDAVSAILGIRMTVNYEGQAAIELEQIAEEGEEGEYPSKVVNENRSMIWDPDPIIEAIVEDLKRKESPAVISARFHNSIVRILSQTATRMRQGTGLRDIFLSGGVFQNTLILGKTRDILKEDGFKVHIHQKVPSNDGGISLGQAFYGINLDN